MENVFSLLSSTPSLSVHQTWAGRLIAGFGWLLLAALILLLLVGALASPYLSLSAPGRDLVVGASVQAGDLLGTIDVLGISQEVTAPEDGIIAALEATVATKTTITRAGRSSAPRSRPAKWYSESVSGTGVTAAMMVPGSAPITAAAGSGALAATRAPHRDGSGAYPAADRAVDRL